MAQAALGVVERLVRGVAPSPDERGQLRRFVSDARSLLPDAGYPGEAAWRALQRASIGIDTLGDVPDRSYWADVETDLRAAIGTLSSLVRVGGRDADIHIIG